MILLWQFAQLHFWLGVIGAIVAVAGVVILGPPIVFGRYLYRRFVRA